MKAWVRFISPMVAANYCILQKGGTLLLRWQEEVEGPSELRCFSLIRAINFIHVGNQTPHDSVTSQEPHFPLLLAVRIQFQKYFLEGIKSI